MNYRSEIIKFYTLDLSLKCCDSRLPHSNTFVAMWLMMNHNTNRRWRFLRLSLQQDYKKQMLTAAHALAVDAKNLLDVIDQSRLKMMAHSRPH